MRASLAHSVPTARIRVTRDRMNATADRIHSIRRRMSLALRTVNAIGGRISCDAQAMQPSPRFRLLPAQTPSRVNRTGGTSARSHRRKAHGLQEVGRHRMERITPQLPNDVVRVQPGLFDPVAGPRTVPGNPAFGAGGGTEYYRGWTFPQ